MRDSAGRQAVPAIPSIEDGECLPTAAVLAQILAALQEIRDQLAGIRKPYYTVAEVADWTGRSEYTVRRWLKQGRIQATRVTGTGPRGRLLIAADQISHLIDAGMGAGVPANITL